MVARSNNLWDKLDKIAKIYGGIISIDAFLAIVTKHYYEHHGNIGKGGDFITAPELNSLFGQSLIIAVCSWIEKTNPSKDLVWVELGPGNGTLFLDMWRLIRMMPQYASRIKHVVFVEYSELMTAKQRQMQVENPELMAISYVKSIEKLDKLLNSFGSMEIIMIANEFFDALPIKQYILNDSKWYEIMVKIDAKSVELVRSEVPTELNLLKADSVYNNAIVELSPARQYAANIIADILDSYGGMALLIDYGYASTPLKNTIQSVMNHAKLADPFSFLGEADISSSVDLGALQSCFIQNGLKCVLKKQGEFLQDYGVNALVQKAHEQLMKSGNVKSAKAMLASSQILIDIERMGDIFHVLQVEK